MWPWGHAAVAYLCYAAVVRHREGRGANAVGAAGAVVGSQLADLVDKPLAWTIGILESGRSFGHSFLVILPAVALLWWWFGDDHPTAVVAVAVGWLSHPVADGLFSLATLEFGDLGFVLWPVTEPPPPELGESFVAHLSTLELDGYFAVQLMLVVAAAAVWRADGCPGLDPVRSRLETSVESLGR